MTLPMTDEQLLQIAADHVGKRDAADFSELDLITTERSELIAFGRAVEAELKKANTQTPDDILPGPLSEAELREQWNAQADEFNQWDSLDSAEQFAWAQKCAIPAHEAALAAEPPSPVAVPTPDDFRRWWRETGSNDSGPTPEMLLTANAWAAAWAAMREPAPAPAKPATLVPVAERPWEWHLWFDAEGRCWWLVPNQSWPCLYLMKADSALAASVATHCLPHWAIPATQAAHWGPA